MRPVLIIATAFFLGAVTTYLGAVQESRGANQTYQSPTGTKLRVLMDMQAVGGNEVELGELTFVPNSDSGDH